VTPSARFAVTVAKDYLSFSSAHFITIPGHQCERLHGHNYRIGVTASGTVDATTGFVVDFGVIKEVVRPLIQAVDHRVLLPARNPVVGCRMEGGQVLVDYRGAHRFTFPETNVAMVPVTDTTAELLAEYFAGEIRRGLIAAGVRTVAELTVEVEESVGQSASYRVSLGQE